MNRKCLAALFLAPALFAQSERSSHDDPVEGENGSIRLSFFTKTLIHPILHTWPVTQRQIWQHTHDLGTEVLFQDSSSATPSRDQIPKGVPVSLHLFVSRETAPGVWVPLSTAGNGDISISRVLEPSSGVLVPGHKELFSELHQQFCKPSSRAQFMSCARAIETVNALIREYRPGQSQRPWASRDWPPAIAQALKSRDSACACMNPQSEAKRKAELAHHQKDQDWIWKTELIAPVLSFTPPSANTLATLNKPLTKDSSGKPISDRVDLNVVSSLGPVRITKIEFRVQGRSPVVHNWNNSAGTRFKICSGENLRNCTLAAAP